MTATFIETPWLPDEMSVWAVGGRGWLTTIVETYGGEEYRNQAWVRTRGKWSFQEALRSTNPLSGYYVGVVVALAKSTQGRLYGFRMRDPMDYQATDAGGAAAWTTIDATHWQMAKTYTLGGNVYTQPIYKPRPAYGSYTGITAITGHTGGTLDYTTGILAGGTGTPTSWTGYYDVPVRFDSDIPDIGLLSDGTYWNWNSLGTVELKNLT